jgi:hypothetical protein
LLAMVIMLIALVSYHLKKIFQFWEKVHVTVNYTTGKIL